jgi:putative endonuclease
MSTIFRGGETGGPQRPRDCLEGSPRSEGASVSPPSFAIVVLIVNCRINNGRSGFQRFEKYILLEWRSDLSEYSIGESFVGEIMKTGNKNARVRKRINHSGTWYLYLLRCQNGSLYTGITTDPARRFSEHIGKGSGGAKYCRANRPDSVVYTRVIGSKSRALRFEYRVKKLPKRKKELFVKAGREGRKIFSAIAHAIADVQGAAVRRR